MSSAKKDRSTAPRIGSRPSKARDVSDRNVKPPAGYRPAGKAKPGERAMNAQLAARPAASCDCGHAYEAHDMDDACSACACHTWSPLIEAVVGSESTTSSPPQTWRASTRESQAPDSVVGTTTVDESTDRKSQEQLSVVDPDAPPAADPWWTEEREKVFQMTLQGIPQHQVAAELQRDRHTVARWIEDERFALRLYDENTSRFKASRQRRSMQTLRLTDKAEHLAVKMLDKAIKLAEQGKDELGTRLAARDWLQEFRENSRREDEIYGLDKTRVDVNVHGEVKHHHKGKVNVSFKAFLSTSLRNMGVDPDAEEIDGTRADEALVTITERALTEGTFLDDLVEREKAEKLAPMLADR